MACLLQTSFIRFVSSISFFYAKLPLSPSQRCEAPFRAYALTRVTNSTRLFIHGKCEHSKMQRSSIVTRLSLHYVISTRAICSIMSAVECPCSAHAAVFLHKSTGKTSCECRKIRFYEESEFREKSSQEVKRLTT